MLWGSIRVTTFLTLFVVTSASATQPWHQLTIIAQTGDLDIMSFDRDVSVNDFGMVSFVGRFSDSSIEFESVLRGDGTGPPMNLASGFSSAGRDFSRTQIRNDNTVLSRDRVNGSPPPTLLRHWFDGGWNTIASSGPGMLNQFAAVTSNASVNNAPSADTAFVALELGSIDVQLVRSLGDDQFLTRDLTSPSVGRPMIADDRRILLQTGSPLAINVYDTQLNPTTIAASGWTSLASNPAMSDDGEVVAFFGDRGNGIGLFVCYDNGEGFGDPVRIAGESTAFPRNELGCSLIGDPIAFASLVSARRPGVFKHSFGVNGVEDDTVVVTFLGTPSAPKATTTPAAFSNQLGIWIARVSLEPSVHVQSILPIVQVNDTIDGASVMSFHTHDPIAGTAIQGSSPPASRHRIAFWAETTAGEMVVRADQGNAPPIPHFTKFKQFTPWGGQIVNPDSSNPLTFTSVGCTISCLATIASAYGNNPVPPVTPLVIRDWINQKGMWWDKKNKSSIIVENFYYRNTSAQFGFKQRSSGGNWQTIADELRQCWPNPLLLAVPSKSKGLASTIAGEKHYVVAYGLNPALAVGDMTTAADVFISDPGSGMSRYGTPANAEYVADWELSERVATLSLRDYFEMVDRLSPANFTYEPENLQVRVEEWFDQGRVYVGNTPHMIGSEVRNTLVRTFESAFTLDDLVNNPLISVASPVEIAISDPISGDRFVSSADIAQTGDIILERLGSSLDAPVDPGPGESYDTEFPPYLVPLPVELTGRDVEVDIIGVGDGDFAVSYHPGNPNFAAGPPITGRITDGQVISGEFNVVPSCDADLDGSGTVGFGDLLIMISNWGACACTSDLDGDGDVGMRDINLMIAAWGSCE